MTDRDADHVRECRQFAALAEARAAGATDEATRDENAFVATQWRNLARTIELLELFEHKPSEPRS